MKLKVFLLKAPLLLLMVFSFLGAIYAAKTSISGVTYATPLILGVILLLYGLGCWLDK